MAYTPHTLRARLAMLAVPLAGLTMLAPAVASASTRTPARPTATGVDGSGMTAAQLAQKFGPTVVRLASIRSAAGRAAELARLTPAPQSQVPIDEIAYDVKPLWSAGVEGQGVTLANIVSFGDPDIQAFIKSYDASYGLPAAHVRTVKPLGSVACPPGQQNLCSLWASETDLDVAMFHTMAPKADIDVVATPVAETLGLQGFPQMMKAIDYIVQRHMVQVISMSVSAPEETFKDAAQIKSLDPALERAKAAGVPVVAGSGDWGVSGQKKGGGYYSYRVVGFPAADPLVTAVGGTELHYNGTHQTAPASLISFSGAGVSKVFARPSWQDSVAATTHSTMRAMPDISLDGESGTSQSGPLLAGILALATQENSGQPIGFISAALYAMGPQGTADGIVDVTKGNNSYNGVKGYTCGTGYDIASGWGTVDAKAFVPALLTALGKSSARG